MKNVDEILQENNSLKEIIQYKDISLQEKDKAIQHKDSRIKILEAYIQTLKQKQFGSSSEKLEAIQPDIFSDSETAADEDNHPEPQDLITITEHQRKTKRTSIPKEIPRIDIIHDLSDAEKFCPHDGPVALQQDCVV